MKNPESKHRKRAREILNKHGYKVGGHVTTAEHKNEVIKAVHAHERHDHPGKPLTKVKLRRGGRARGGRPHHRADKRRRGGSDCYDEGGAVGSNALPTTNVQKDRKEARDRGRRAAGGKSGGHKTIVIVAGGKQQPQPMPVPVPRPVPVPTGAGPAGPPGGPPPMPPRPMPPGAPPGMPPGMPMRKKGGRMERVPHMTASAANAIGRLEKRRAYGIPERKGGGLRPEMKRKLAMYGIKE